MMGWHCHSSFTCRVLSAAIASTLRCNDPCRARLAFALVGYLEPFFPPHGQSEDIGMASSSNAAKLDSASPEVSSKLDSAAAAVAMNSLTLREVSSRLSSQPSQMFAHQLLEDIPILEEWQRAPNPSHKVRDAMMKLGSHWKVAQKSRGQKRRPAEVAKELEERMLEKGKELLTSSVAQPAPQTESSPVKASAPKKPKTAVAAVQPASLRDMFARQKRTVAPSTVAESTDAEPPASQGTPKQPRLQHSSSSTAHAEPRPEAAQQSLQPTVQQTQTSESTPSIPSAAAEGNAKPRLQDLLQQLKGRRAEFPKVLVQDLFDTIGILLEWKRAAKPTNKQRSAMRKSACNWDVTQKQNN